MINMTSSVLAEGEVYFVREDASELPLQGM